MRLLRSVLLSLLPLALLGCAADDPFETTIVAQPTVPEAELEAEAADGDDTDAATDGDEVELDCLGNPARDPETFPPTPEDEINRPSDDRIEDLRGQAQVVIPIRDNVYDVRWFRVDPCTELIFDNRGANPHNVIASADGAFTTIDEDALMEGNVSLILPSPGDYPFYCSIHGTTQRGQTGYVIVGDG